MKKIMLLMGAYAVSSCLTFAGMTVAWDGQSLVNYLYSSPTLGNTHLAGNGYLIQLVIDTGTPTVFSQMTAGQLGIGSETALGGTVASAADDTVGTWNTGSWTLAGSIHYAYSTASDVTGYASKPFYFRWFNASTQLAATEAGIIYNSAGNWITPASESAQSASANLSYGSDAQVTGSEYTTGALDGWATVAPVPEPTTMALMGLGLAAVAARRRFAKKA